jgi:hypothetical protein
MRFRIRQLTGLLFLTMTFSCSTDTIQNLELPNTDNTIDTNDGNGDDEIDDIEPITNPNPIGDQAGNVEFFNKNLVDDNYILVNDAGNNFVYLMDKNASVLHQWNLNGGDLGNDCFLLEDGQLLAMVESDDPIIQLGGNGGKIQLLDYDGTEIWSFTHSSNDYILHHDAEMLPNGNILAMTWERKSAEEAIANGYLLDVELFPDGLIEINPNTSEIVWEWHVWNHMVQNNDDTKANFGSVPDNPQLIDINYNQREDGDISHGNGIAYDAENDVIFLSANFYSEVWVIDHSTTTEEAASHEGGTYQKGGDLIYRFGNPSAYQNNMGERLFHNNHYPNLLKGERLGNMLIFTNGGDLGQSTVYELELPEEYSLNINNNNEPNVVWSFTDTELYSAKVSGADLLPNGNILITEGDFGIWEVTREKEIVWKFNSEGFFWRAYPYSKNAPEIQGLEL